MPSIPVPKTLLSVLLLSVISSTALWAADSAQVYRFGGWTLIAPPTVTAEALASGSYALPVTEDGIEFLAYWQDGRERALALRFSGQDLKKDVAVLKSAGSIRRLSGCELGPSSRLKALKSALSKTSEPTVFPDDGSVTLAGSDRGLRRVGDMLVADLGSARVQISEDSPVVRLGEWGSADFCRFELKTWSLGDEE